MIQRRGSSDMIECHMLNRFWLDWTRDPDQERGKIFQQLHMRGKPVLQATVP